MLSEEEIKSAIANRVEAVSCSCNSTHILHNRGCIRGLLWALNGCDPGPYYLDNIINKILQEYSKAVKG